MKVFEMDKINGNISFDIDKIGFGLLMWREYMELIIYININGKLTMVDTRNINADLLCKLIAGLQGTPDRLQCIRMPDNMKAVCNE